MKRNLSVLLLSACVSTGLVPYLPAATADCEGGYGGTHGSTCSASLSWSYNSAKRQFEHGGGIRAQETELYDYKVRIACDANEADAATESECRRARSCPTVEDDNGQDLQGRLVMAFRRLKADAPGGSWQRFGTPVCEYIGQTVPMADVVAAVQRRLEKEVGKPTITAQPPNRVTLVNFVSIFSAPAQQVTSLSIDAPVPGTLTGAPEYSWDLDDGITQTGAGHPYDSGKDPRDPGTDGFYVKAKYESKGRKDITLTLTWRVTMTLGGAGTVALDPIVFTANDYTEAREKRAVLVNN